MYVSAKELLELQQNAIEEGGRQPWDDLFADDEPPANPEHRDGESQSTAESADQDQSSPTAPTDRFFTPTPSGSNFVWDPVAATEAIPDSAAAPDDDRDTTAPTSSTNDRLFTPTPSGSNFVWDPVAATGVVPDTAAAAPDDFVIKVKEADRPPPAPPAPVKEAKGVDNPSTLTTDYPDSPLPDRRPITASRRMGLGTKILCWAFAFVVLCVCVGVLAASLKKVPSTEMGVQYDVHRKQLEDATKSGGLFLGPPGFRFIKFPSTFITVDLNDRTCVSNDGLLVQFSVTFQYQMTAANVLPAIIKYRDFHKWASAVEQAGLSAVHHSCSEFIVSEFQNKRGIIQNNMEENLKIKLEGDPASGDEGVNAVSVSLQLTFIELPAEYNEAVSEKQAAEEDIALAVAQRVQETTKANTELLRSREEARKIEDTARNEAEVLLTEARLQAEETTYSFQKEAQALVEVKEQLNLTTEGVLAYLSNRLLSEASTLRVTTGEPAKLSQRDEL